MTNKIKNEDTRIEKEVCTEWFDRNISRLYIHNTGISVLGGLQIDLGDLVTYTDFRCFWREV